MTHLYVIQHPSGWVKVGRARDALERLRQHQQHAGKPLVGIAVFETAEPKEHERAALDALSEHRVMGEWFDVDVSLAVEAVKKACGTEAKPFPPTEKKPPKRPKADLAASILAAVTQGRPLDEVAKDINQRLADRLR